MSRSNPLSVYVISDTHGVQKIGVSDNIPSRIKYLQSPKGKRLTLVSCHDREAGDARLVERTAHELLANKRLGGEWFDVTSAEAVSAVEHAIRLIDDGTIKPRPPRALQDNVIGVRLDPEDRAALEKAAAADDRSVSALARKIISEWLKKEGLVSARKK